MGTNDTSSRFDVLVALQQTQLVSMHEIGQTYGGRSGSSSRAMDEASCTRVLIVVIIVIESIAIAITTAIVYIVLGMIGTIALRISRRSVCIFVLILFQLVGFPCFIYKQR